MAYTAQINSVVGGFGANCYVTIAEATSYLAARVGATGWGAMVAGDATTERRERLLIEATRMIDRFAPFLDGRLFCDGFSGALYPSAGQPLKLPTVAHRYQALTIGTGGTTKVTPTGWTLTNLFSDELNEGSVIVTAGAARGQHRRIADFTATTGEITVDTAFSPSCVAGDSVYVLWPLPNALKHATIEQAWALYMTDQSGADRAGGAEDLIASGITSYSGPGMSVSATARARGVLCKAAIDILRAAGLLAVNVRIISEW